MNWTKLTTDNEELLYKLEGTPEEGRIVLFQNGVHPAIPAGVYFSKNEHSASIHTLAKCEDVYFYIIPRISVT